DLPPALQDIYSQAVGRYAYAVLDDSGRVLFSSLKDRSPIFSADPRSSDVTYQETRHGNATVSGVSLVKKMDGRRGWVQSERISHIATSSSTTSLPISSNAWDGSRCRCCYSCWRSTS